MGDRQRSLRPEDMATTSTAVATVPPQLQEEPVERVAVITLRPTRQQQRKKVVWTEDTVDNEHMNKKKSKCCCIYKKPRNFGESESDDSEDECEHCFGHVEARKLKQNQSEQITTTEQETVAVEPTATLTLQPRGLEPAPPDDSPSNTD